MGKRTDLILLDRSQPFFLLFFQLLLILIGNMDKLQSLRMIFFIQFPHVGMGVAAGMAPRTPEVNHHVFASVIRQFHLFAFRGQSGKIGSGNPYRRILFGGNPSQQFLSGFALLYSPGKPVKIRHQLLNRVFPHFL
ncbi:unknown [Odoribacter splanchnicus CAG:14]|nr:unknown [Odoribacter splanchnicus CAG:14]